MISIIDVVDTDMAPKVNRKKKRPAKLINAIVHPPYFRERETYIFFCKKVKEKHILLEFVIYDK